MGEAAGARGGDQDAERHHPRKTHADQGVETDAGELAGCLLDGLQQPRRTSIELNLFDLLLNEIHIWETLENEHQSLAIEILARLIANAAADNHNQEESHE